MSEAASCGGVTDCARLCSVAHRYEHCAEAAAMTEVVHEHEDLVTEPEASAVPDETGISDAADHVSRRQEDEHPPESQPDPDLFI